MAQKPRDFFPDESVLFRNKSIADGRPRKSTQRFCTLCLLQQTLHLAAPDETLPLRKRRDTIVQVKNYWPESLDRHTLLGEHAIP